MKKALLVAGHPDDIELGASGLVLKLKEQGWSLSYVVFSQCETDSGLGFTKEEIMSEFDSACELMGVEEKIVNNFPNTRLPSYSYEIRSILGKIAERLHPDLVLIPSVNDPHQDHSTVAWESIRTFRTQETILGYELHRHGSYLFNPNVFVDISKYLEEKIKILMCYKSQLKRPYFSEDVFRSIARMRGSQVGIDYAEAFEAVKIFY